MLWEIQVPKGLIQQPVCKLILLVHRYSSVLGRTKEVIGIPKGTLLAVRWVPHASKGAGDISQAGQSLKNKHVKQMQREEIWS